jgi:hypothetical protein
MLVHLIFIAVAVPALFFGVFLFRYPLKVFEFQRRFYLLINWRIEPVSLEKEIRNTKIMGLILILITLGACVYKVTG